MLSLPQDIEIIGKRALDAAYTVHSYLGPGLLESVYQVCYVQELQKRKLFVESQVPVPIYYDGEKLEKELVLDILLEKSVIVELKAVESINPVFEAQLLSYMKLSNISLGYLINFNVPHLKDGIRRRILTASRP